MLNKPFLYFTNRTLRSLCRAHDVGIPGRVDTVDSCLCHCSGVVIRSVLFNPTSLFDISAHGESSESSRESNFDLLIFSACMQTARPPECNYHFLIPDDPPYAGNISSYNFPFVYQNHLTCNYAIHLPSHLAKQAENYQLCFTFYRCE